MAADFNGDGRGDIAITDESGGAVTVLLGAAANTNSVLTTAGGLTVAYGASVPLTLKVTLPSGGFNAPAGMATFLDGGTAIGNAAQAAAPYTFAATGLAAGSHSLTALYGGNSASTSSSSNTVSITVTPNGPTTHRYAAPGGHLHNPGYAGGQRELPGGPGGEPTLLGYRADSEHPFAALASQTFGGAPFPIAATATSGLAVAFTSTTMPVCTVSGTTVTLAGAGTCTIRASQAGNSSFAAAPAVSQGFTVAPGIQTITFAALADRAFGTAPFTVSATASSGAAVSFASTTSSTCTVAKATVTLASAGTCTIQASQPGTVNYAAAAQVNQGFMVTPGSQTISFAVLPGKVLGVAPFTVSATASSGLAVSFSSTTSTVCSVSAATVTLVLAGMCTVEADQAGSGNYAAATPVDQSFTVTPGSQTIKFGVLANQALGTAPFMLSATATSGLPVSFATTTAAVCTVAGSTVTLLTAGTCTIAASQTGNTNYAPAPTVSEHFTVTPGSQTIAFAALPDQAFGTTPLTLTATASSGLTVSFAAIGLPVCTVAGATVTLVSVGVCTVQALQAGNANYAAATPVVQTFTVYLGGLFNRW